MKKFLLLSAKKSFLIKGLLIKLEDAGLSSDYASAGDPDVDSKMRDSEMFIFYMDSDMQNNTAFINHIADTLKKDGKMVILIGKKEEIEATAKSVGVKLPANIEIIEPSAELAEKYVPTLVELRKAKGMTPESARAALKDNVMLATMMLKFGEVDGLVSGAIHSTAVYRLSHGLRRIPVILSCLITPCR